MQKSRKKADKSESIATCVSASLSLSLLPLMSLQARKLLDTYIYTYTYIVHCICLRPPRDCLDVATRVEYRCWFLVCCAMCAPHVGHTETVPRCVELANRLVAAASGQWMSGVDERILCIEERSARSERILCSVLFLH